MTAEEILAKLRSLPLPTTKDVLSVSRFAGNAFLAVDNLGRPHLYFQLPDGCKSEFLRSTKALELLTSNSVEILEKGRPKRRTSGFIIGLLDNSKIWRFATIACEIGWILAKSPHEFDSEPAIDEFILDWAEFFAKDSIGKDRAVGLWGELFAISSFPNPDRGVACWTGPLGEPFDFTGKGVFLEIKTSTSYSKAWFSIEQLRRRSMSFSWFLRVSHDAVNGRTLDELIEHIVTRLETSSRFEALLARTGYSPGIYADLRLRVEDTSMLPNRCLPTPSFDDRRILAVRFQIDIDEFRDEAVSHDSILGKMA